MFDIPFIFVASFVDRRPEAVNAGSFVVVSTKLVTKLPTRFATKIPTKVRREEVLG
jgi:hypothetical protein